MSAGHDQDLVALAASRMGLWGDALDLPPDTPEDEAAVLAVFGFLLSRRMEPDVDGPFARFDEAFMAFLREAYPSGNGRPWPF